MTFKIGNIIQFKINREEYHLKPTNFEYGNILSGSIKQVHKDKLSIKMIDIWGNGAVKFITINRSDVIQIL